MVKKIFFLLSLCMGLFLTFETQAFVLNPTKYLITVAPGASQVAEVTVTNDELEEQNYAFSVIRIEQDDLGRTIASSDKDYLPLSWVKPEKSDIMLAPGESAVIKYIIDVPKEAEAGSYYIGFSVYPLVSGDRKIGLNSQLATVVYLKVAGLVNENLDILKWETNKIKFDKNFKFSLNLKNSGNMEVDMVGNFSLKNYFNNEVYSESVVLGSMILSGEDRNIIIGNSKDLKILPGFYHADLSIIYGQSKQIVNSSYGFWYLPWWSVVLFFGFFLLLLFFIKKFLKK